MIRAAALILAMMAIVIHVHEQRVGRVSRRRNPPVFQKWRLTQSLSWGGALAHPLYGLAHEFPGQRYRSVLLAVSLLHRFRDESFRPGLPVVVPRAAHDAGNLMAPIPLLIQNG
jgi:hypothetical protein